MDPSLDVFSLLSRNARFAKKKPEPVAAALVAEEYDSLPEETSDIQKLFKIRVKGSNPPSELLLSFASLPDMRHPLKQNIENSRFKEPTPVQMQAIPAILTDRDVLAVAPTGSGKTAAFLLPRLQASPTDQTPKGVHTLVVCPTHELCDQIFREQEWMSVGFPRALRKSCTLTKANQKSVQDSLRGDTFHHLVVATPMLLVSLLNGMDAVQAKVSCVVFDECDRLFEDTFVEQTDEILQKLAGTTCQRLMFSATMPPKVESLANTILRDAIKIFIGSSGQHLTAADTIKQTLLYAGSNEGKFLAFKSLLKEGKLVPPVLIFVEEKVRARDVSRALHANHPAHHVDAIHGDRAPAARDLLVKKFREGQIWFLVATEVVARGLDFRGVNTVINWDLPRTPVSYIHRIGRCGRAGRPGTSVTFFTDEDVDSQIVRPIANVVKQSHGVAPDWVLQLKKRSWKAGGKSNTGKKSKVDEEEDDD